MVLLWLNGTVKKLKGFTRALACPCDMESLKVTEVTVVTDFMKDSLHRFFVSVKGRFL
jgi:hypothetical protein